MKRTMTPRRRHTAAGLALVAVLGLTGCQQQKPDDGGLPPLESVSSPAPASSSSADSSEPVPIPSNTEPAFPEFDPVVSDAPKSAEEGKEQAFEAVQLYYDVQVAILKSGDPKQTDELYVAAMDPYAGMRIDSLRKALEEGGHTYEGKSAVELIEVTAGPLVHADGSLTDYGSVRLTVCEDNSKVKVTDEKGKPVGTGTQRYRVDYGVRWNEQTGEWRVNAREVPKENESEAQAC